MGMIAVEQQFHAVTHSDANISFLDDVTAEWRRQMPKLSENSARDAHCFTTAR
jgi:hypothetical protein